MGIGVAEFVVLEEVVCVRQVFEVWELHRISEFLGRVSSAFRSFGPPNEEEETSKLHRPWHIERATTLSAGDSSSQYSYRPSASTLLARFHNLFHAAIVNISISSAAIFIPTEASIAFLEKSDKIPYSARTLIPTDLNPPVTSRP